MQEMQYISNIKKKKKTQSQVEVSISWNLKMNVIVVHLLGHIWLFATQWTAACQASLFFTLSQISKDAFS